MKALVSLIAKYLPTTRPQHDGRHTRLYYVYSKKRYKC